jgi:hypothetical protein
VILDVVWNVLTPNGTGTRAFGTCQEEAILAWLQQFEEAEFREVSGEAVHCVLDSVHPRMTTDQCVTLKCKRSLSWHSSFHGCHVLNPKS